MQKKIIIIIMIIVLIGITGCSLKKGDNNTSSSTTNNLLSYNELFSDRDFYDKTVSSCEKVMKEQEGALEFVINVIHENI